jgi:hypothetical protein
MLAKVSVRTATGTKEHSFPIDQQVIVGRGADCDLSVDEVSVSRQHCSLVLRGDILVVNDLQSAHGLVFQKQRVTRCELGLGGTVRLGAAQLRFVAFGDRVAASPVRPAVAPEQTVVPEQPAAAVAATSPTKPAASRPNDPLLGETLGGYRIEATLGSGGAAVVYRAVQTQLAREVALKVLRLPPEGEEWQALPAFLREARAAAALADPRLVQVFDLSQDRGLHFLSMEYVRGGSLQDRIRREGRVAWQALLPILIDVAGALLVAHSAGMVHRDVKPANILLGDDGRAKLADLGLVRSIGGEADRAGTAAFMAPEQIRGQKLDGRTDLYALGCTAYAALAGKPPFGGSTKEMLKGHRDQEPPPLPLEAMVPPALQALVRERLMAKDPGQRPQGAAEVLADLERIAEQGFQPVARRGRGRSRRPARGGSGAMLLVALLLLVAVGTAAVWLLRNR